MVLLHLWILPLAGEPFDSSSLPQPRATHCFNWAEMVAKASPVLSTVYSCSASADAGGYTAIEGSGLDNTTTAANFANTSPGNVTTVLLNNPTSSPATVSYAATFQPKGESSFLYLPFAFTRRHSSSKDPNGVMTEKGTAEVDVSPPHGLDSSNLCRRCLLGRELSFNNQHGNSLLLMTLLCVIA